MTRLLSSFSPLALRQSQLPGSRSRRRKPEALSVTTSRFVSLVAAGLKRYPVYVIHAHTSRLRCARSISDWSCRWRCHRWRSLICRSLRVLGRRGSVVVKSTASQPTRRMNGDPSWWRTGTRRSRFLQPGGDQLHLRLPVLRQERCLARVFPPRVEALRLQVTDF